MDRFDVAVIGGGPAGCAAAISASLAGAAVALVDRERAAPARLGELLEPDGVAALNALTGAPGSYSEASRVYSIGAAWHSKTIQYRDFVFHPAGAGLVVDRARLMEELRRKAAQLDIRSFKGIGTVQRRRARDWQCTVRDGRTTRTMTAHMIVLATGRGGCAMRPRVPVHRADRLLTLARLFRVEPSDRIAGQALLEAAPSSWWFGVPVSDCLYAVSCFSDADIADALPGGRDEFFAAALQTTMHLKRILDASVPLGPVRVMDAATCFRAASAGPDWVCAGDSSSALDPLTGFGLSKALMEGSAAGAFAAGPDADAAAANALLRRREQDRFSYIRQHASLYASAGARFGTEFWRRRMDRSHALS